MEAITETTSPPLKILLIEDNPGDERVARELLAEAEGSAFEVSSASRVNDGIEMMAAEKFDAVLLDLHLPDSFGLGTLGKVKEASHGTAIIVKTSLADETTAREALKQGAQDYLIKGEISPGLLARSIRYAIERKRAEETFRQSEKKYRELFDNASDILFTLDLDGNITSINNAVERIAGYTPGELVGNSLTRYLSPEAVSYVNDKIQLKLRDEQEVSSYELEIRTKGGRRITLEVSSRLIYENEEVTGITGLARDITDRKEAEKALQAERDRLDILMENSPEANLVLLDRDFNFIMVNEAYARSCRRPKDFFPGKNHFDLYPHAENEAIFRQAVESGKTAKFKEKPFEFSDMPGRGVTYWDWSLTPVKDVAGRVQTLVFSLIDVTDKVNARKFSETMNEINETLASSLNFRQIINQAMDLAELTLGADSSVIAIIDREPPYIYTKALDEDALPFPKDKPFLRSLVQETGGLVAISDYRHDDRVNHAFFDNLGLRALLAAPLEVKGHIFGVLAFGYRSGPVEYSPPQLDFMENLAALFSMAIENSRLYENEQELRANIERYASQLAMVHRISLFLNRETDKHKLLDSVLSATAGLTGAGLGALALTGEGSAKLVSTYYAPWFKERCGETPKIEDFHRQVSRLLGKSNASVLRAGGLLSSCFKFVPDASSPDGLLIGVLRDTREKNAVILF